MALAVQDSDTDGGFGLLTGQLAGLEVVVEDALVACHRGFRVIPTAGEGFQ